MGVKRGYTTDILVIFLDLEKRRVECGPPRDYAGCSIFIIVIVGLVSSFDLFHKGIKRLWNRKNPVWQRAGERPGTMDYYHHYRAGVIRRKLFWLDEGLRSDVRRPQLGERHLA